MTGGRKVINESSSPHRSSAEMSEPRHTAHVCTMSSTAKRVVSFGLFKSSRIATAAPCAALLTTLEKSTASCAMRRCLPATVDRVSAHSVSSPVVRYLSYLAHDSHVTSLMMSSGHLRSWWVSILQVFFNSIRYNLSSSSQEIHFYTL